MQKFQAPYLQYDSAFPHLVGQQMPSTQASLGYGNNTVMSPFCAVGGVNQTSSRDAVYVQWPSHAMMYAQSYDQFRHAVFQVKISTLFHHCFFTQRITRYINAFYIWGLFLFGVKFFDLVKNKNGGKYFNRF